MALCPYCNTEYIIGEIYCKNCDGDLSALDVQPAPTASEPVAALDLFGHTSPDFLPPAAVAAKGSEERFPTDPLGVPDVLDVPQLPIGIVTPGVRDHLPEEPFYPREDEAGEHDQVTPRPIGPVCPSCGMTNEKDSKFCDGCGKPLAVICPKCQGANRPGARFCQHDGYPLGGTISGAIIPAPARVATKTIALMVLSKAGHELARFPLREGVNNVGAKSAGEGILPEVDLGELDTEQVISRRHAVLRVTNDRVTLADCGSTNGTRVDGTKIGSAQVPVDERSSILFGNLHTRLVSN